MNRFLALLLGYLLFAAQASNSAISLGMDQSWCVSDKGADSAIWEKPSPNCLKQSTINKSSAWLWTKIPLKPSAKPRMIELAQPLLKHAILWVQVNGIWQKFESGNSIPLGQKSIKNHHQVFELAAEIDNAVLIVKAENVPIPVFIWDKDTYISESSKQGIQFGIYLGIVGFVVFTNLLMALALRKSIFLHYSLLVFLYGFFSSLCDGYILYIIPTIDLNFWYTLNPIINQPNGLLYAILFLEIRKYCPLLYKFSMGLFAYFVSFIFWHPLLGSAQIGSFSQLHALIGIMAMAGLGLFSAKKGNRLGNYFALAYLVFFGIALIEVIYLQTGIPKHLFDLSYVSLAILTEIGLLSLLLTKRVQWEKEKMEQAQYQAHYEAQAAKELNEAKSDFVNTISHELRTPLTSILGFTAMAKVKLSQQIYPLVIEPNPKHSRQMKQVLDNLEIIENEGERLKDLITEVLDLAKMESGRMDWKEECIDLAQILERTKINTTGLFTRENLVLRSEIKAGLWILGDSNKLLQVFINLISNAVKFTDQGEILLKAYSHGQVARVEVKDSGIGIAPEDFEKVFEKFKQVGKVLSDRPKGTGLGLPICKEIVEHHQGMIWLESSLGEGSTFIVDLPLISAINHKE